MEKGNYRAYLLFNYIRYFESQGVYPGFLFKDTEIDYQRLKETDWLDFETHIAKVWKNLDDRFPGPEVNLDIGYHVYKNRSMGALDTVARLASVEYLYRNFSKLARRYSDVERFETHRITATSIVLLFWPMPELQHYYSLRTQMFLEGLFKTGPKVYQTEMHSVEHPIPDAKVEVELSSVELHAILMTDYKHLAPNARWEYEGDLFLVDGEPVAKKIILSLERDRENWSNRFSSAKKPSHIYSSREGDRIVNLPNYLGREGSGYRVVEDFRVKGRKILSKGQIFNAPYTRFNISWKKIPFLKRVRYFVTERPKSLQSSREQLLAQLEVADQRYAAEMEARKHAEEKEQEVRRLQNYLANIINSMPSALVGVNEEGNVTQWNAAAQSLTGIDAKDALGQPLARVLPVPSRMLGDVRLAIQDQIAKSEIKVPWLVNGELRYEDVTIYPLESNGLQGAVIRVDDVTDRVRMEETMIQSEKMLSVGGLAAGMAHEINNPLGAILQACQNIVRRVSPEIAVNARVAEACGTNLKAVSAYLEKREILVFLDDILQSGKRAADIVSNMLGFSRKLEKAESSADIAELLDKALALAGSDYDLKKCYDFRRIEIVREYAPEVPRVVCQANKIQQVFLNILRNGAEAMYEHHAKSAEHGVEVGTPRFVLRVKREDEMVRVEIEDNGAGLDETTRRRVFEPFFTTKAPGIGTGLGLSVSYFIITEEHRGTLSVESRTGGGARFIIQLPVGGGGHGRRKDSDSGSR